MKSCAQETIVKSCAQETIPALQEWEVTNGNKNCKEHRHRLWSRTFPEQKWGKNYLKEAAEHISPDPEQSTSICQHSILTTTFWDGSMYFHCIVTKITAIKTTQWMLELALHKDGHTAPHCCYAPGAGRCCSPGIPLSRSASAGRSISRNPANRGQNSSVSTFSWPFVLILILKPSEVKSPLYINTWYKMAEQCLEPFHKLLKIVP